MSRKSCCGETGIEASGPIIDQPFGGPSCSPCAPGAIAASCSRVVTHGRGCVCSPCRTCKCAGCCGSTLPNQTPYYAQASMCPEDNRERVFIHQIAGALKTAVPSCMPACGLTVRIVFQDLVEVPIGAWLWAYGIGYLEIKGFNPVSQEVELLNLCPSNCPGQAAPGTQIPGCTLFAIQAPICGSATSGGSTSLFPYLNSGFTAPVNGACIDITLTNVNGLSVGRNISINGGIYRLSAIKSATLVTICNDGAGLTPGVVVNYQDAAGNLIVPIVTIDSNPCLNDPIYSGVPLVCDVGVTGRLFGTENNQVLVWNNSTLRANFRTLGIPVLDCTELTVCLTLDPELPPGTNYLAVVADTSAFTVGELVTIAGTDFHVFSIPDATHIYLTPVTDPSAIQTYGVGSALCSASCCEILDDRLKIVEARVLLNDASTCEGSWLFASANDADAAPLEAPINTTAGDPATHGNEAVLNLTNESCVFTMGIHYTVNWLIAVDTAGTAGQAANVITGANLGFGVAPVPAPTPIYFPSDTVVITTVPGNPPGVNHKYYLQTFSGFFTLAPGETGGIRADASFAYANGDVDSFNIEELAVRISYMAVAIS